MNGSDSGQNIGGLPPRKSSTQDEFCVFGWSIELMFTGVDISKFSLPGNEGKWILAAASFKRFQNWFQIVISMIKSNGCFVYCAISLKNAQLFGMHQWTSPWRFYLNECAVATTRPSLPSMTIIPKHWLIDVGPFLPSSSDLTRSTMPCIFSWSTYIDETCPVPWSSHCRSSFNTYNFTLLRVFDISGNFIGEAGWVSCEGIDSNNVANYFMWNTFLWTMYRIHRWINYLRWWCYVNWSDFGMDLRY